MHELAITESIVSTVSERLGGARIARVRLEIGKLSAIVPDAVRFCFEVCARGTTLEGAMLEVVEVPGQAHCRDCSVDFELQDAIPLCACGSANLELRGGQSLLIREVEVV